MLISLLAKHLLGGGSLWILFFVLCVEISAGVSSYGYGNKRAPIQMAINSRHSVHTHEVNFPNTPAHKMNTIEVKSDKTPSFTIKFKSASSRVKVLHEHKASEVPKTRETFSEDEPHILKQKISRPIVQEIHEVISPYRRIVQEIGSVVETIKTIISKKSDDGQLTQGRVAPTLSPGGFASPVGNKRNLQSLTGAAKPATPIEQMLKEMKHTNVFMPRERLMAKKEEDIDSYDNNNSNDNNNQRGDDDDHNARQQQQADSALKKKPDLVLSEEELVDNSIYGGAADFDLRHVSPNVPGEQYENMDSTSMANDYFQYDYRHNHIYKDRR